MKVSFLSFGRCLALAAASWLGLTAAQAGSAGMIARTWDQEITLPTGAYRASKPIQMDGHFTVTMVPGTYLEGVDFLGKEHDQTFKIEGALLRKSKLIGQLGFRVEAKDTAFDECELHRTGGWFVDMWGSRWRFDNCVITHSFLLPEIDVGNYAIHATRCTFLGVRMPAIKYKGDPSKYTQGEELRFEKCRFIQCDVPESLLAACVDCVFEDCQFPSKKADLNGATQAIKVVATVLSGHLPPAVLNNKLSIQFVASTGAVDAGSTLPYSATGGRLALPSVRIPQQFTMLGTTDKKASEIVDTGGAAAPAGGAIPASTPALISTGTEIRSIGEVMQAIPASAELVSGGIINPAGVEAANKQLQQVLGGKPIALRLSLDDIRATQESGFAFQATAREVPLTYRGLTVPVGVIFLFRPGDAAALGKVGKGSDVNARGTILKAELQGRGRGLAMIVTVGDSQLP